MNRTRWALPLIVLAEVLGTSLWFGGTAALDELTPLWSLDAMQRGSLLTVVQLGFIVGTLVLSMTGLADAFAASRVFAVAALLGRGHQLGLRLAEQRYDRSPPLAGRHWPGSGGHLPARDETRRHLDAETHW